MNAVVLKRFDEDDNVFFELIAPRLAIRPTLFAGYLQELRFDVTGLELASIHNNIEEGNAVIYTCTPKEGAELTSNDLLADYDTALGKYSEE